MAAFRWYVIIIRHRFWPYVLFFHLLTLHPTFETLKIGGYLWLVIFFSFLQPLLFVWYEWVFNVCSQSFAAIDICSSHGHHVHHQHYYYYYYSYCTGLGTLSGVFSPLYIFLAQCLLQFLSSSSCSSNTVAFKSIQRGYPFFFSSLSSYSYTQCWIRGARSLKGVYERVWREERRFAVCVW